MIRAQGAIEFLFIAALVTTVAAAMVVPAVRETEASMALSAAREGAFNAALSEKTELTSIAFLPADGGYVMTPAFSVGGRPVPVSDGVRQAMLTSMARVLSPSRQPNGNCVSGVFAKYCVSE